LSERFAFTQTREAALGDEEEDTEGSLWGEVRQALIPVLISAGSLIGFVAFAGAVILWTRFTAIGVPPEQAIDLAPQGELVAIGSVFLLLFGFFGALATIAVFLVDRRGRPVPGMARTLLFLLMVEGVVAIVLVEGRSAVQTIGDAELFVLPLALCLWATALDGFTELRDDLPRRTQEKLAPRRPPAGSALRPFEGKAPPPGARDQKWYQGWFFRPGVCGPVFLVAAAMIAAALLHRLGASDLLFLWVLSAFGLVFLGWVLVLWGRDVRALRGVESSTPWLPDPEDEEARRRRSRPLRLDITGAGVLLTVASMVTAVGLVWWRLGTDEWWILVALVAAAVIAIALWRVASLANASLIWFGIAVFLSVPVFGTLGEMVNNLDHPKVQPMALIRETDGPKESIQGLYVTETGDRIYFANVATEGCRSQVTPHSGRLLWVPKDEVVAESVGPLQSVTEAGKSALEMSYSLTPAVETRGASIALGIDEKKEEEERAKAGLRDTRLENAGPAVRPNFGTGLRLEPESVSPGAEATLRMNHENAAVEGFGPSRAGHNLRLGGKIVDIAKEPAGSAEGAEYIELENHRLIGLAKQEPYVEEGRGEFELLNNADEPRHKPLYVRLKDPAVQQVEERDGAWVKPPYVRVVEGAGGTRLASRGQTVSLSGGRSEGHLWESAERVPLDGLALQRQAWHPDHIRFHVPHGARSGVVTVECDQLAGSPLLQITHTPTARLDVRVKANSPTVVLSSARSSEEGEGKKLKQRWKVDGVREGHSGRLPLSMPPRRTLHTIQLTVTDKAGHSDTATLLVLRLPTPGFKVGAEAARVKRVLRADRKAIERAVEAERPKEIELDGYTDAPRRAHLNLRRSLGETAKVRRALLPRSEEVPEGERAIPVAELAHGESCRIYRGAGRRLADQHVDLFVLDEDVLVRPTKGCHAKGQQAARWFPLSTSKSLASISSVDTPSPPSAP
jgi:hypothetical protein